MMEDVILPAILGTAVGWYIGRSVGRWLTKPPPPPAPPLSQTVRFPDGSETELHRNGDGRSGADQTQRGAA